MRRDYTTLTPVLTHAIEPSAASQQTAVFGEGIRHIRVHARQDCWIAIGASPTAAAVTTTGASVFMPAGATEYFSVNAGMRLAVIEDAATTGAVIVTEMSR